jgi:hypothetical protein
LLATLKQKKNQPNMLLLKPARISKENDSDHPGIRRFPAPGSLARHASLWRPTKITPYLLPYPPAPELLCRPHSLARRRLHTPKPAAPPSCYMPLDGSAVPSSAPRKLRHAPLPPVRRAPQWPPLMVIACRRQRHGFQPCFPLPAGLFPRAPPL